MELELISRIKQVADSLSPQRGEGQIKSGIGDDCAEIALSSKHNLLLTTDTMAEGVHFSLAYFSPYNLGRKLASINLSDIAAMGGRPVSALLNIEVPHLLSNPSLDFWSEFARGLAERLGRFGAFLVGGDTVKSACNKLSLTLTLAGEIEPGKAIYRGGAEKGDLIFCSGFLGESACGLKILKKRRARIPYQIKRHLVNRHLDPVPRVELGRLLAGLGVTSMIDISDGLATDLAHICKKSKVKAALKENLIPCSRALKAGCRALNLDPLELALTGGEDFELAWTASSDNAWVIAEEASRLLGYWPFFIGKMEQGEGVWLEGCIRTREITFTGYEH